MRNYLSMFPGEDSKRGETPSKNIPTVFWDRTRENFSTTRKQKNIFSTEIQIYLDIFLIIIVLVDYITQNMNV